MDLIKLNAYRSCLPDVVGCEVCSSRGIDIGRKYKGLPKAKLFERFSGFETLTLPYFLDWQVTCASKKCTVEGNQGLELNLRTSTLKLDESPYTVTFSINIGEGINTRRFEAAPIKIQVLDGSNIDENCELPKVSIISKYVKLAIDKVTRIPSLYANTRRRGNVLQAKLRRQDGSPIPYPELRKFSLQWMLGSTVVAEGALLKLDRGAFEPGSDSLTFTLFARQPCSAGADPFAKIVLKVNSPPSGGSLSVVPNTGLALKTKVSTLTVANVFV